MQLNKLIIFLLICLVGISINTVYAANQNNSDKQGNADNTVKSAEPTKSATSTKSAKSTNQTKPNKPHTALDFLTNLTEGTTSVRAVFVHKIINNKGEVVQETSGNMAMQYQHKFLWQITKPSLDLLVMDEVNVWHYDEELQQVTIQSAEQHQQLFPMELLLAENNSSAKGNSSRIGELFWVKKLAVRSCKLGADQCFTLQPKTADQSMQQLYLGFNGKQISYLIVWDQLGQQSEFIFSKVELNPKLAANTFKFIAPRGVDVIGTAHVRH